MVSPPNIAPEVESLYAPQVNQLGIALQPRGIGLYGHMAPDWRARVQAGFR